MAKWWQPSDSPITTPWIHPDAVQYLSNILHKDMTVIEYGGGGSTRWIAERVEKLYTYEPNPKWYAMLENDLPGNVELRKMSIWNSFDKCDLLFIDGEPVINRGVWLSVAPNTSCEWVVLDNANRPEYAQQREAFSEFASLERRVDGNEAGTRHLVTEFWRII